QILYGRVQALVELLVAEGRRPAAYRGCDGAEAVVAVLVTIPWLSRICGFSPNRDRRSALPGRALLSAASAAVLEESGGRKPCRSGGDHRSSERHDRT